MAKKKKQKAVTPLAPKIDTSIQDRINITAGVDTRSVDDKIISHTTRQLEYDKMGKNLDVQDWGNNTFKQEPLMIGSSTTREQYDAEQKALKRAEKRADAQLKADQAAAGSGSNPDLTNSHMKHQNTDPILSDKIKKDIERSDFIDNVADEVTGLDNGYINELKKEQVKVEKAIEDYKGYDTGRTVKQNVAGDTGGFMPGNTSQSSGSNTKALNGPVSRQIGASQSFDGQNGTFVDIQERNIGFEERLKRLDQKRGTNHAGRLMQDDLASQGIRTNGASTVGGYRASRRNSIPTEAEAYKKIRDSASKTVNETVSETVEAAGKQATKKATQEGAEGLLKGMTKSKIGKTIAGVGVAALLVSNMNKSKGQQSNQELYGQRTPYM